MTDVTDLRTTIVPKSDQLNSEQLLAGPMILTVSDVRAGGGEDQPVSIFYEADPGRPFRPCKTMRKVLILAWGADGTKWIGKSMELYCEPSVKFGGELVGGIRISRLSDIPKAIKVSLTATKGRKSLHEIGALEVTQAGAEVLSAIALAVGRESLKKAAAMAKDLTNEADIALARAAYARKVEQLKTGTPPKPETTTITAAEVEQRITEAMSAEVLEVARAQIASVSDEAQRMRLDELADARGKVLAEDSGNPF